MRLARSTEGASEEAEGTDVVQATGVADAAETAKAAKTAETAETAETVKTADTAETTKTVRTADHNPSPLRTTPLPSCRRTAAPKRRPQSLPAERRPPIRHRRSA